MRIFVYGTLRAGGAANHLLRDCEMSGTASVTGTLYDVDGRFPALTLVGAGRVRGEVWTGPDDLLAELDAYEGVEQGLFRRTEVVLSDRPCWVYVAGPLLQSRLVDAAIFSDGVWPPVGPGRGKPAG